MDNFHIKLLSLFQMPPIANIVHKLWLSSVIFISGIILTSFHPLIEAHFQPYYYCDKHKIIEFLGLAERTCP